MPGFSSGGLAWTLRQGEVAYLRGVNLGRRQKCVQCLWLPPLGTYLVKQLRGMAECCTFTAKFWEVCIGSMLGLDGWTQPRLQWEHLSDTTAKGFFYCHQRKACSSKIHLSCFRWIIWIQVIYPTRTHLSSLTMIISAINVCAVQRLPLVTQISFWLRAQIINMPETLHQAFFDYTILCTCKINASYIILLHTVKVADFWPRYRDWTWKLCSSHAKWNSFFFRCCMSTPGK